MGLLNEIKIKMGTMEKDERQKTICEIKNFIIDADIYEFTAKRFLITHFLINNTEWSILWKESSCELQNKKTKNKKVFENTSKYDEIRDEQMGLDIISYLGINKEYEEWVSNKMQIDSILKSKDDENFFDDIEDVLKKLVDLSINEALDMLGIYEEESGMESIEEKKKKKKKNKLTKKQKLAKKEILDIELNAIEKGRMVYKKNKDRIGKEKANELSKEEYKNQIEINWSRILSLSKK
jgi:hypothetical protein